MTSGPQRLDPTRPYKPLDVGNGVVAASVDPWGRLLALGGFHPEQGYVTLEAQDGFPDLQRHDPQAVRRYRGRLAAPDAPGLGLAPAGMWEVERVELLGGALPASVLRRGGGRAEVVTWAPDPTATPAPRGLLQCWRVTNEASLPIPMVFTWQGQPHLGRAAMTQLTEGGILPSPPDTVATRFDAGTLTVRTRHAGAAALAGLPARDAGPDPPATIAVRLDLRPGETHVWTLAWALGADPAAAVRTAAALLEAAETSEAEHDVEVAAARWRARWAGFTAHASVPAHVAPLVRRAVVYALGCCVVPVGEGVCVVTDHRILPLSWTRDAYWVLHGLLAVPDPDLRGLVRRHLLWLFEAAERPEGVWGRAYLPTGRVKDPAFQLDQQCYPLLELAEYLAAAGSRTGDDSGDDTAGRLRHHVPAVLEALERRRADGVALYPTDETPADDPLGLPYHFSSHVLFWRTLQALAAVAVPLALDATAVRRQAERIRREATAAFTARLADGEQAFAYAVDLDGAATIYHDANDLPTAFAPLWGFCDADDPRWRGTMVHAFDPDRNEGCAGGALGGLGSVHTPGAWPLGDVQELVYARVVGDPRRRQTVLRRLTDTACWDGALPEARDPETGAVRSRHWFAWPGAALTAALLR